jgi:chromosome partitioning protein
MRVITVAQQKGGVAKTTLAIHIAAEATRKGRRAVILELDRQGTASRWSDLRPYTADSQDLLKGVDRAKSRPRSSTPMRRALMRRSLPWLALVSVSP